MKAATNKFLIAIALPAEFDFRKVGRAMVPKPIGRTTY
jgi:hypothetical protein